MPITGTNVPFKLRITGIHSVIRKHNVYKRGKHIWIKLTARYLCLHLSHMWIHIRIIVTHKES